jgi:U3 small nucleolar RNA-associated protein 18
MPPSFSPQAAALEAAIFNSNADVLPRLGGEAAVAPTTRLDADGPAAAVLDVFADRQPAAPADGGRAPAWEDSDDEDVQVAVAARPMLRKLREEEEEVAVSGRDYERRLRQQHAKLNPRAASWATTKPKEKADAAAEALLTRAGGLLAGARTLPPGRLEATRLRDANQEEPAQAVIRSVEFHPSGQLLMAASLDKHLRFFSVDGVDNPKVQSIYLEDMPVHKAAFANGGAQVIATGRRSFFYVLDLETAKMERVAGVFGREERSFESFAASPASQTAAFFGRDGAIPLVSLTTRQATGTLKMNGTARAGAFSADGQQLLTSGGDGMIYLWDMRMQRCLEKYSDEGSIGGAALAASPDGATFASGSTSGIVNVYRHPAPRGASGSVAPAAALSLAPLKALPHLTTTADTLAFSADGAVLAMASRMKRDALRLVHVPTLTVFSNWPTSRTPLHYVHSLAFSPGGGYLAVGNAKGRVVLYRMHHYPQA